LRTGARPRERLTQAGIAQLVEHKLPKLGVAGSNPVARSSDSSVKGPIPFLRWFSPLIGVRTVFKLRTW
jgi:hypothetical protein